MSINTKKRISYTVAGVSLLVGVGVMSFAQSVSAFATANGPAATGSCLFSLELQKSVQARRSYLVKLDQVLGRSAVADNSVEGMYGKIEKASYSVGSDEEAPEPPSYWDTIFRKAETKPGLDHFSADCISCHDGVGAVSIGIDLRNRPFDKTSRVTSFKSDHPLGMNYQSYVNARRGFKPVWGNKMVFVNGQVGCLTCHDPLNPEKGHLVMSDRGSALCLTCHDK